MKNKQYLQLGVACLVAVLAAGAARAYDSTVAAEKEAKEMAQTLHDNRQKALRDSILLAMYTHGEGELGHTSTPCRMLRNNDAVTSDIDDTDVTYACTITAKSGNVYDAEIELLNISGQLIALPAFLTLKENDEVSS